MRHLKEHNLLNIGIYLVITGCMLGILLGQGTHLHTVVFHLDGHLDIQASLHAHSSHDHHESSHHQTSPKKKQDNHQHKVLTFDIEGVTVSTAKVSADLKVQPGIIFEAQAENQISFVKESVLLFNLPPPLLKISDSYLSSFSFRGPPVA